MFIYHHVVKYLNEDLNERNISLTKFGLDLFLYTIYRAGQLSTTVQYYN